MAGPYNIRDATYDGTDPDPVEWANQDVKPAITDLDLRAATLVLSAPPVAGLWSATPGLRILGQSTMFLNRLWLCPIYIRRDASISEISFKTAISAAAGGIVRVGIWTADANQKPSGLPVQSVTVDVTSFAGRYQTGLPANAAVTAPLFWIGLVQQVAGADIILSGIYDGGNTILAEDDGHFLEGDMGGMFINDAYYLDSVSGALPNLTSTPPARAVYSLPRHAVRFA